MSEGNVKIKQLKYKSGDLIAPYTPAHAVYTSSGTRLDYELGKIDVISAATDSSLSNFKIEMNDKMDEFEVASTNKFNSFSAETSSKIVAFSAETTTRFNGFSAETATRFNEFSAATNTALDGLHQSIEIEIKAEINDLSGKTQESIGELYDATFPIQLSMSVTPSPTNNNNPSGHTVSLSVTQKSKGAFIPDKLELKKSVNGGTETSVYTGKTASYTYTSNIEGNIERFTSRATKTGRTEASASQTRYICAYATSYSENVSDDLFKAAIKKSTINVKFNPSLETELNQYIWIFVPSKLSVSKITNGGFNVTMKSPVTYELDSGTYKGTYKAYRTENALRAATWNLEIT